MGKTFFYSGSNRFTIKDSGQSSYRGGEFEDAEDEQKIPALTGGILDLGNGTTLTISTNNFTQNDGFAWVVTSSTYVYDTYGILDYITQSDVGVSCIESSHGWVRGQSFSLYSDGAMFRLYASPNGNLYESGNPGEWYDYEDCFLSDDYLIAVLQLSGGYWVLKSKSNQRFWGTDFNTAYGTLHISGVNHYMSEPSISYSLSTGEPVVAVLRLADGTYYAESGAGYNFVGFNDRVRVEGYQFSADVLSPGTTIYFWTGGNAYDLPSSWTEDILSDVWALSDYLTYMGGAHWNGSEWVWVY